MRSLSILYDRLVGCLGYSSDAALIVCVLAETQLRESGRFAVEAGGGWIIGRMSPQGVELGK